MKVFEAPNRLLSGTNRNHRIRVGRKIFAPLSRYSVFLEDTFVLSYLRSSHVSSLSTCLLSHISKYADKCVIVYQTFSGSVGSPDVSSGLFPQLLLFYSSWFLDLNLSKRSQCMLTSPGPVLITNETSTNKFRVHTEGTGNNNSMV